MEISVIICTHNRAEFLEQCLRATLAQVVDQRVSWEIVVVANACTDQTASMVATVAESSAVPVRCMDEALLGLSHARNAGIAAAQGRTLCFLDDDAQPAPGHLAALTEYFSTHPDIHAGGGPIELDWGSTSKPSYWQNEFDGNLGRLVFDPPPEFFPQGQFPFGGNMFIRAGAFRTVDFFNPALGMVGRQLALGEETDWFLRYAAGGGKIAYVPRAGVRHWVDPQRISRRSLWRRAWRTGIAAAGLHDAPREARGWLHWMRHCVSSALRGRLVLTEQLYLLRWLGQLWGQRHKP